MKIAGCQYVAKELHVIFVAFFLLVQQTTTNVNIENKTIDTMKSDELRLGSGYVIIIEKIFIQLIM